jgi:pimeloyl-ACP methyl ester carboxylesterase
VLAAPERVRKLILCSTTPGGPKSVPIPQQTVELMGRASHLEPQEALRRFVVNGVARDTSNALVDEIIAYRAANPPDPAGWWALAGAGATHDAFERLGEIRVPTLVFHGTADNVVDVRNAPLLANGIRGARLEIFEGVGHLLPWERPEEFTRLVEEFLA